MRWRQSRHQEPAIRGPRPDAQAGTDYYYIGIGPDYLIAFEIAQEVTHSSGAPPVAICSVPDFFESLKRYNLTASPESLFVI